MAEITCLSEEERKRFAEYCRQEALTADGMSRQAEKLGPAGKVMARMLKVEASAFATICRKLENTEHMTVGVSDIPPGQVD